jgi:hypothetical protein
VNPRAGLDDVEKRKFLTLPGPELRPLSRPEQQTIDSSTQLNPEDGVSINVGVCLLN